MRTSLQLELSSRVHGMRQRHGAAIMAVLNATPDSFSDGGRYDGPDASRTRVEQLVAEGADIVDIGGESTRPGAQSVSAEEQVRRIEPAVRHALGQGVLVSIDTTSPEVADYMLGLGAHFINDVSCLADQQLAEVAARHGAVLVLMHSRGPMSEMPGFSQCPDDSYADVVTDVFDEWCSARDRAMEAGLHRDAIWLDPGLGFAKNAKHSFELLRRLDELAQAEVPVVLGPSRKSFIAAVGATSHLYPGSKGLDNRPAPAEERIGGTLAACLLAVQRGAAMLRVHDVFPVRQALDVAQAGTIGLAASDALRRESGAAAPPASAPPASVPPINDPPALTGQWAAHPVDAVGVPRGNNTSATSLEGSDG